MSTAVAVLLLHGQPGSARDWDWVVKTLSTNASAIAIDRPGWDGRRSASDLAGNTAAAIQALDDRGIERAAVVGHSLGAAVAVRLAIEHPERISALVLASPAANAAALHWFDSVLAAPIAGSLTSFAALSGVGLALATPPLRRVIADGLGLDEAYLGAASRGLLAPAARRAFVSEQRMLVSELPALEQRLGEIRVPTTIVYGASDRIVSLAAVRALAEQITGARLVVLEGAGHLLPQRRGAQLAQAIWDAIRGENC